MNKVEGFFAKILLLRWYIVLLFAIILVAGSYSLLHIKIDAIPDITNKQVVINTKTGAMDPIRVEKAVTYLVESEMYGNAFVDKVWTFAGNSNFQR
jgi:cobalt-zinc-cadmium resistance protein CzcA